MNTHWSPITESGLINLLSQAIAGMDTGIQTFWHMVQLPKPELWQQHPWGDEGCGFWVLAVMGKRCIYYNDITQGFCLGNFSKWGVIDDYQDEKLSLSERLLRFLPSAHEPAKA